MNIFVCYTHFRLMKTFMVGTPIISIFVLLHDGVTQALSNVPPVINVEHLLHLFSPWDG